MKYIVHKYYSTFESFTVEAPDLETARSIANDNEEMSTEEIMLNLERWEDADTIHPGD